ncbi:hypothetical protein [Scytonema hofmannii]|nr:hypothetical protein [Scytonema hofmannii]
MIMTIAVIGASMGGLVCAQQYNLRSVEFSPCLSAIAKYPSTAAIANRAEICHFTAFLAKNFTINTSSSLALRLSHVSFASPI